MVLHHGFQKRMSGVWQRDCTALLRDNPIHSLGGSMKQLLLMSLFVCASLQVACTKGTESTTQAAREPQRRLTSSDLQNQIESNINSDEQLRTSKLSISADADRNSATVSGTVESEA